MASAITTSPDAYQYRSLILTKGQPQDCSISIPTPQKVSELPKELLNLACRYLAGKEWCYTTQIFHASGSRSKIEYCCQQKLKALGINSDEYPKYSTARQKLIFHIFMDRFYKAENATKKRIIKSGYKISPITSDSFLKHSVIKVLYFSKKFFSNPLVCIFFGILSFLYLRSYYSTFHLYLSTTFKEKCISFYMKHSPSLVIQAGDRASRLFIMISPWKCQIPIYIAFFLLHNRLIYIPIINSVIKAALIASLLPTYFYVLKMKFIIPAYIFLVLAASPGPAASYATAEACKKIYRSAELNHALNVWMKLDAEMYALQRE